ncbi:MAG: asparaginase domain-containing protein [Campylobacterota bacterium]|nr:asparaginase domain-containing protein [Campylobacterota bacterium]
MKNKKKILILNTGGTFNKCYNQYNGKLLVSNSNYYIKKIIKQSTKINKTTKIDGLIYKDSLDITKKDRKELIRYIKKSRFKKIIIVHGTDTIGITAKYLDKKIKNKQIVLVGSMRPFSIEPIEATANLMMAYGFLQNNKKNCIFIGIHGLVKKYNKIEKNRKLGVFV